MATPALLKLKHKDIGALSVFCLIGLFVGCFIPDTTWSVYTSILVADHLFLGWLVFMAGDGVKRSQPIFTTIGLHLGFVVLVLVLVALRHSIPHFGLLPYAMVPVAFWLLSSAAGYEFTAEDAIEPSRQTANARVQERELSNAFVQTRLAMRAARVAAESGFARFDPARRPAKMWPVQGPSRHSTAGHRPRHGFAGSGAQQPSFEQAAPAQPAAIAMPSAPAMSAPQFRASAAQPAVSLPDPPPEWAARVLQVLAAAAAASEAKPESGAAHPQPAANGNGTHAAAAGQPQAADAIAQPQTDARKNVYKQTVAGIELPRHFSLSPDQPKQKPALLRDMEIAEEIRRRYSDEDAMFNPILAASAEDHEEWLLDRATFNPTHRKPGTSVKEQYEEWLRTRTEIQVGLPAANGIEAVL